MMTPAIVESFVQIADSRNTNMHMFILYLKEAKAGVFVLAKKFSVVILLCSTSGNSFQQTHSLVGLESKSIVSRLVLI